MLTGRFCYLQRDIGEHVVCVIFTMIHPGLSYHKVLDENCKYNNFNKYNNFSPDLFEKMVPMMVQQSMSIYSQRKAETVNRLVGTMREATNLCNGYTALCLFDLMLLCLCTSVDSHVKSSSYELVRECLCLHARMDLLKMHNIMVYQVPLKCR